MARKFDNNNSAGARCQQCCKGQQGERRDPLGAEIVGRVGAILHTDAAQAPLATRLDVHSEKIGTPLNEPYLAVSVLAQFFPLRVVALNAEEGWSRDVSETIAAKVRDVAKHEEIELTSGTLDFIEMHTERMLQPTLPLW